MILTFLAGIGGRAWGIIAAVGGALLAVLAIRQSGKAAGRAEVQNASNRGALERSRQAQEARDNVDRANAAAADPDTARVERMRKSGDLRD